MGKQTKMNTVAPDPAGKEAGSSSEGTEERGAWGGQIEFLLTMIGYAVGLGNIWRFPYLAFKNGGGAFLIPYVLMLIFVGIPIFFFELSFGQFASLGPITIWNAIPIARGIGYCMVAVSWIIGLYYNIVICYAFYFFFASMTDKLPWSDCSGEWTDEKCISTDDLGVLTRNETAMNLTLAERNLTNRLDFESPSEQFFYNEVLKLSSSIDDTGTVVWELALCMLLSWVIIYFVLIKGINSLGKVMYVVTIFPYIMLTVLLIRGCTLEGAWVGIEFYLKPEFDRLTDGAVWSDAAAQIFFSLSNCYGGLIAMSSYNNFRNNCLRDSIMVPLINCGTSIYAGFAIFSVLGFMAVQKGVDVEDVADEGPGLVFVVYPEAISQMPVSTLWAILFFIMLIFLGFSSQFSIVETCFVAMMDEFPNILRKNKYRPLMFRGVCITVFFLITIPMVSEAGLYFFTVVDSFVGGFPLLVIGIFELVAMMWGYGLKNFSQDIKLMTGKQPNIWWKICWVALSPAVLLFACVFKAVTYEDPTVREQTFPDWAIALGWMIVTFSLMWIPVVAVFKLIQDTLNGNPLKSLNSLPNWGPADPANRTGRYASAASDETGDDSVFTVTHPKSAKTVDSGHDNPAFVSGESEQSEHI